MSRKIFSVVGAWPEPNGLPRPSGELTGGGVGKVRPLRLFPEPIRLEKPLGLFRVETRNEGRRKRHCSENMKKIYDLGRQRGSGWKGFVYGDKKAMMRKVCPFCVNQHFSPY
jgi:hypothetical protein